MASAALCGSTGRLFRKGSGDAVPGLVNLLLRVAHTKHAFEIEPSFVKYYKAKFSRRYLT